MFNLQLANTYYPTKNYEVSHWWASPKLDGVRGLYIAKVGLISRSQKTQYLGLPQIESVCEQITAAGYQVVDGELHIPGEKFDVISGIVRKAKKYDNALKQKVQFRVFALGSGKDWKNTEEMIQAIAEIIPSNQTAVVPIPYTQILNNPVSIQAQNQLNKSSGASDEGTVLRHPDIAYYQGRSHHLLKVKNFEKSQLTITGFSQGTGKYKNSLGKLRATGIAETQVGTGFTDTERLTIWNNQTQYLGRDIEVIHLGITNHKLRHPVFSRFL